MKCLHSFVKSSTKAPSFWHGISENLKFEQSPDFQRGSFGRTLGTTSFPQLYSGGEWGGGGGRRRSRLLHFDHFRNNFHRRSVISTIFNPFNFVLIKNLLDWFLLGIGRIGAWARVGEVPDHGGSGGEVIDVAGVRIVQNLRHHVHLHLQLRVVVLYVHLATKNLQLRGNIIKKRKHQPLLVSPSAAVCHSRPWDTWGCRRPAQFSNSQWRYLYAFI